MKHLILSLALPALLASAIAVSPPVADVGDPIPKTNFEEFAQSDAKSMDDFAGRVILVEFFEHW